MAPVIIVCLIAFAIGLLFLGDGFLENASILLVIALSVVLGVVGTMLLVGGIAVIWSLVSESKGEETV